MWLCRNYPLRSDLYEQKKINEKKNARNAAVFLILLLLALVVAAIIILAGKCSTKPGPPTPSQTPGGITIDGTPGQTATSEPGPTPSPIPAYTPIPNPTSIDSTSPAHSAFRPVCSSMGKA